MSGPKIIALSRPWIEDDLVELMGRLGPVERVDSSDIQVVLEAIADAEAIVGHIPAGVEFFDAAPRLRVLSTVSVGFNHIDIEEATRRSVLVCHTPGVLNRAVVDVTMALIYSLALRLRENEEYVRSGGWARGEQAPPLGRDIRGKTLGVVGFGRIGQAVTARMQMLGMKTIWYDRFTGPFEDAPASEYRSLEDLCAESDYVTIHANWEPGSPPLIGAGELELMKGSAFIVNTARGPVIDQDALTEALASGSIAGAGLDVVHDEPPSVDERIVKLPNVVCYPHIGSATEETRRAMRELAVDNLMAALRGERPRAPVNPEVLD